MTMHEPPHEPETAGDTGFSHAPVMVDEVVATFAAVPEGWVVDATVGGGGHAAALLEAYPAMRLLGLDQDPDALAAAARRLGVDAPPHGTTHRVRLERCRFDALPEVVARVGAEPVAGVLFDLGVSSHQFDVPGRGFSYRHRGPLDMRMDPDGDLTAADIVNTWPQEDLEGLLRRNADERFAKRIAAALVAARPVGDTTELAEVVRNAIPAATRRRGRHPALRTFQALRIEVNHELEVLGVSLRQAIDALTPGGRIAVLSYHSGEDRIAKQQLRHAATGGCTCDPALGCGCGATPTLRLLRPGGWTPSDAEVAANPRAASARLRAGEKLFGPGAEVAA